MRTSGFVSSEAAFLTLSSLQPASEQRASEEGPCLQHRPLYPEEKSGCDRGDPPQSQSRARHRVAHSTGPRPSAAAPSNQATPWGHGHRVWQKGTRAQGSLAFALHPLPPLAHLVTCHSGLLCLLGSLLPVAVCEQAMTLKGKAELKETQNPSS